MGVPQARSLLDVACGTGKHLEHLGDEFDCEGLDLNPEFVKLAQQRTGVRVHSASMDAFDIEERFDAVVCLFSSIGYTSDLPGAIGSMARHLNPDGVLIIEPWLRPDQSVGNVSTRHSTRWRRARNRRLRSCPTATTRRMREKERFRAGT